MHYSFVSPVLLYRSFSISSYAFCNCSAPQSSTNKLLLYNVFVCSFPCLHQLLSHFVTGKGATLACSLLNTSLVALCGNERHLSFFTLHDNTLEKMILCLLQICLMVIHMNFLSPFPCQSVCIQIVLFSVLFFHSSQIFYININKVSIRLYNISTI